MKFAFALSLTLLALTPIAWGESATALQSIDTGHTITRVRTADFDGETVIIANTYEGKLLAVRFNGSVIWENALSGYMNHDVWCADITGDGRDEVLAANADGSVYCVDDRGGVMWAFRENAAPMNAVCAVRHEGRSLVVCGGYDKNLYYLDAGGKRLKTIPSAGYARTKEWGEPGSKRYPTKREHIANFIRVTNIKQGKPVVVVHGAIHSMASTGAIYLFQPMADEPFQTIDRIAGRSPCGDLTVGDIDSNGEEELLLGSSAPFRGSSFSHIDPRGPTQRLFNLSKLINKGVDRFGYRVAQTVVIGPKKDRRFLTSFGSSLIETPVDCDTDAMTQEAKVLRCGYSFNDLWKDPSSDRVVLASAQSGGSCVHLLDTSDPGWKQAYLDFQPSGNLKKILDNTAAARAELSLSRPSKPLPRSRTVNFLSESINGEVKQNAESLEREHGNPVFFANQFFLQVEKWDRSSIPSRKYRDRRDRRKQYTLSQQQALDQILPLYNSGRRGIAFWAGHGNDPYLYRTDTIKKVASSANGQASVFIYPELEDYTDEMQAVLDDHIYPLAEYLRDKRGFLYLRNKHAFWHGVVHLPMWSRIVSGEFADVFIPSMEETTDKSMEQTIAARLGLWASGAVDQWGSRCARDNASFDRLRQHAHQMKPNHFLRNQVYHIASGATYQNNFAVDQEYFSFLYELIAHGVLYVPDRSEIVSFSPVHLSMTTPDMRFIQEGNNAKWLTFFDAETERANPMVFSRLNGTWPGAAVTDWDFSRYAAAVKDRRLNFLPPYPHGMVLITPVQSGPLADVEAPRGRLEDHMHPLYQGKLTEFITDGHHYLSASGDKKLAADKAYRIVEQQIKKSAELLPLTVSGNVAWVAAHTSPTHLRLTLIDGGYLNPSDRTAVVKFHAVRPKKIVSLLDNKTFDTSDPRQVTIAVPCGLFRFLDIELTEPLPQE